MDGVEWWAVIVLSALITLALTLLGVVLGRIIGQRAYTQKEQKGESRPIERDSRDPGKELVKAIQLEKLWVYKQLFRTSGASVATLSHKGGDYFRPAFAIDLPEVKAAQRELRHIQLETELVASPEVVDLSAALYVALERCWSKLFVETGRRKLSSPEDRQSETIPGAWEEVTRLVQEEARQQHVEELFLELRDQIRKELGLEAIDTRAVTDLDELRAALRFDKLDSSNLEGADLAGANLRGIYLRGAILRNAILRHTDLRGADLQGADLQEARLEEAHLEGANLADANLRGTSLQGAILRDAILRYADLHGATLIHADLRGADLEGAKLEGANLAKANLIGANPMLADVEQAATLDGAIMPDGSTHY